MGARPIAAFLSIAVPSELTITRNKQKSWLDRFLDGLLALAAQYNLPLAGGDTAESPSGLVAADIILVGAVKKGQALLRATAQPGDFIYVTGSLGGAAAELLAIERNPRKFNNLRAAAPKHPHLYPEPRIAAGRRLAAKHLATAGIDLSDGLSTDLQHLCEESNLAAEIIAAAIPIHPMAQLAEAAGWTPSALDLALNGGEDYELLFTASPKAKVKQQIGGVPIHLIGKTKPKQAGVPTLTILDADGTGQSLLSKGWQHFAR
jgi:thiamine-monophosphate kinase